MVALQAGFLFVRARPYGDAGRPLLLLVIVLSAAAGLAVALVPDRLGERFFVWLGSAATSRRRATLVVGATALALGVAGVLTQQVPSWDEASVLWAATVCGEEGVAALFARYGENAWLGPQHPPLVPLLYGAVSAVFGPHLKLLRLVNLLFACGTLLAVLAIVERLWDRRTALVTVFLLLASPLFVRIATAATNDMPLTFFFVLAVLVALRLERSEGDTDAVALGVVLGVGLLVKYTMVLVVPVLLAFAWRLGRLPLARRHAPVVLGIALAFLLVWLDQAYAIGVLGAQQARLGRLATVAARGPGWALDALFTKTPSALGVGLVPFVACGALGALRRRTTEDVLALLWIVLVFVPLLLTLPDNRYFLPAFPPLMALAAVVLTSRPRWAGHVLVLAWLLCAITFYFYARIDLAEKVFLFR
jgi:4-amino-4-deoxy-L-arabinose transferase-like glycosyltransferase